MRKITTWAVLGLALCTATIAHAASPLVGAWKFNPDKSKLTGETIHFTPAGPGAVKYTAEGRSYTFKTDGSDATTSMGSTVNWTRVDDTTWKSHMKRNDVDLGDEVWKLEDGGQKLMSTATGTMPSGKTYKDDEEYTRVGTGKGFFGSWKNTRVKMNTSTGYVISEKGDGSLEWQIPDIKGVVEIKLDGKDYAPTGPTVPKGLTLALTKAGPRSFHFIEKMNGKPIFHSIMTASADGTTLTEVGSPAGVNEPTTSVYEKQ